jgi:hypothetical protein
VFDISRDIKTIKSPFLFLALDLPPAPIFQDLNENRIIPQVPLGEILAKYDGETTQVSMIVALLGWTESNMLIVNCGVGDIFVGNGQYAQTTSIDEAATVLDPIHQAVHK